MFIDVLSNVFIFLFNHPLFFPLFIISCTLLCFSCIILCLFKLLGPFSIFPKIRSDSDSNFSSSQNNLVVQSDISDNGACLSSRNYDKTRYQTKIPKYKK